MKLIEDLAIQQDIIGNHFLDDSNEIYYFNLPSKIWKLNNFKINIPLFIN